MDNANPSSKDTRPWPPAAYLAPRQYRTKESWIFSEDENTQRFTRSCEQLCTNTSEALPSTRSYFKHLDLQCV